MEVDVKIAGTNYTGVPYITLPLTAGGSVKFCEVSDTTATTGDVASGKTFYTADGELKTGTASVGGDTSKRFTVIQKPNQTLSVTPDGSYTAFSTSTDSSGNVVYKTEYPSKIIVSLEPNSGYNAGKITINGVEKDSATVNPIQYYSDLVDGMVISATDATAISSKSFTDVTLNLTGIYSIDDDELFPFNTDSQSPSSPEISHVVICFLNGQAGILLCTDDEYQDCTIKLDTGVGLSENTYVSYDSTGKVMCGKISNQMYTHLKEAGANGGKVTLTITVVS